MSPSLTISCSRLRVGRLVFTSRAKVRGAKPLDFASPAWARLVGRLLRELQRTRQAYRLCLGSGCHWIALLRSLSTALMVHTSTGILIDLYQFRPMLGPAEDWPIGSIEWAGRDRGAFADGHQRPSTGAYGSSCCISASLEVVEGGPSDVIYWTCCGLAALPWLWVAIEALDVARRWDNKEYVNPDFPGLVLLIVAAVAVTSIGIWLIGRAARYVLANR